MDRMDVEIGEQAWILRITQAMSLGHGDAARDLLTQCLRVHPASGRANYLMAAEPADASDYDAPEHFLVRAYDAMSNP